MFLPKPQKYTARLANIEKISSKVYLERFELVEPKEITFLAGQTVMLYVARGINRAMSIASPPSKKNVLTFVHDVTPMGPYAKWALSAKAGGQMQLMGPLGNFIYEDSPRRKIFVATGTGIAPFHSMIFSPSFLDPCVLYWGLRHEEDIFWKKELEDFSSSHPNFRFILTLSKPSASWTGKQGHVCDHVFAEEKNLPDADVYLCGSKEMVSEMRTRLAAASVPDVQVKSELFY